MFGRESQDISPSWESNANALNKCHETHLLTIEGSIPMAFGYELALGQVEFVRSVKAHPTEGNVFYATQGDDVSTTDNGNTP